MGTPGGTIRQLEVLTVLTGMGTPMRAHTRAQGTNIFEGVIHPNSFESLFWAETVKGVFRTDTVEGLIWMDTVEGVA